MALFLLLGVIARDASAQTLSVASGEGQITAQNFPTQNPLVVAAKDASGRPLAGVPVNWSLTGTGSLVPGTQTLTGSDGRASISFVGATIFGSTAFTQTTITASTGASSVAMHVTTSGVDSRFNSAYVQPQVISPTLDTVLSGAAGSSGAGATVEVLVSAVHFAGAQVVPNVAVRLIPDDPNGPSLACAEGTGVTDDRGIAKCLVIFSGPSGNGLFSINVGEFRTFSPFRFTVTPGAGQVATALRITGGNNQSGLPGSRLPAALTARVEDAAGNPVSNVAVVWQPLAAQAVSLSGVTSTSDANGLVSATATLGSAVGAAQVQLRIANTTIQAVFSLIVGQQAPPPPVPAQGQAAALRILGGNNQSGAPGARLPVALTARVEDAAGNPLANIPVFWQPAGAQPVGLSVALSNVVSTSDAQGMVSAVATLGSSPGPVQVQVRTSGGIATPFGTTPGVPVLANFALTVAASQPVSFRIINGNNQSGLPGARLPAALTARVEDAAGNPVPNIAVVWQPVNAQWVTLSDVVSTSDANGMVSANATLGPSAGAAQVRLRTGNGAIQTMFTVTVLQTQPAALRITGGNNQLGAPGVRLPAPLSARVEDAAGNPVPNIPVVWQPVNGQSVSLSNVVFTSDATGMVSALATLGLSVGAAQVQLRIPNTSVQTLFTLQAAVTITGVGIIGGNNQEAAPGSGFAQPLTVQVSASERPPAGLPVQFTSTGAPVSLSNGGSAITDSNGRATVAVQAGSTSGAAIVTVSVGGFSTSFNLTIRAAQPAVTSSLSFFNAGSGQPGGVSPGEMVAVYAARLAPNLQGCATPPAGPLPLALSGVRIQFAAGSYTAFAPLFSVCNTNGLEYAVVQTPVNVPLGDVTVTALAGDMPVGQSTIAAIPVSPGIFETAMPDGGRQAMLQRPDGSFVSPENPARRGERLRAFVTGLGKPVTVSGVPIDTNQPGIVGDDAKPAAPVRIVLGARDLQIVSSIYATNTIGVYVLTFDVPGDAPAGSAINFAVATLVDGQYEFAKSTTLPIR